VDKKNVINVGPGTVIGAMAVGDGAKVEGSVSIGAEKTAAPPGAIQCKVEIRRMAPWEAATYLRKLADQIDENEAGAFAKGSVQDGVAGKGIAWSVSMDK